MSRVAEILREFEFFKLADRLQPKKAVDVSVDADIGRSPMTSASPSADR